MSFSLAAQARTEKADALRAQSLIPAVIYGPNCEATNLTLPGQTFEKLYEQAGYSNLISLTLDGKDLGQVVIKDIQIDPLKRNITHADLYQVDMSQEMNGEIGLTFLGTAPAVKMLGGNLHIAKESINMRCLPSALVDHIDVDLSILDSFDKAIYVKDLNIPEGITVEDDESILVAKVDAPLSAEQLAAMEETQEKSVDDVASEEGKKEEEAA